MTRSDCIVLAFALVLVPALYSAHWGGGGLADQVQIVAADGAEQLVSLHEQSRIRVSGPLGDSVIEIRDGAVRFVNSPCNGKYCIHAGWLQHGGEVTACLPNRITLAVLGADDRFDSINF